MAKRHKRRETTTSSTADDARPRGAGSSGRHLLRWAGPAGAGALSVVLLSLSFPPFNLWPLAYFALVPWLVTLYSGRGRYRPLLFCWLVGLVFWLVNIYWLWWITLVGYFGAVVYLSLYWLAAGVVLRAALRRRWPMWITLPVVWVALEYARAYVISGFPWFYLAHSQWARTPLIQIADLTGVYGLSFFVAMVNGAVADLLLVLVGRRLQPHLPAPRARRLIVAWPATALACAGLIVYGYWRLAQAPTAKGPVIGLVQHSYPIALDRPRTPDKKVMADFVASSEKFIGAGADLVVWPETMLPSWLNPQALDLAPASLDSDDLRGLAASIFGLEAWNKKYSGGTILLNVAKALKLADRRAYAEQIASLSRKLGCGILAGGITLRRNTLAPVDPTDWWVLANSAMLFDGSARASQIYSKVHLVPFGEYVPFKRTWPGLYHLLRSFVPAVMEQLEPGRRFTTFQWTSRGRRWRLASPICYEGAFARICRAMVVDAGRKRVDLLANMSNDGWFVHRWFGRGPYMASNEQSQHLVQYCFRAVENRVPVVRAVNTGITASIDSSGRIVAKLGTMVDGYRQCTMISGVLLLDGKLTAAGRYAPGHGPQVLVDDRLSVYSLVGDVFAMAASAVAVVLVIVLWLGPGGAAKRQGDGTEKADR